MVELTFERILILLITLIFVLSIGVPLIYKALEAINNLFDMNLCFIEFIRFM